MIPFGWGYLYLGRTRWFALSVAAGLTATLAGVLIAVQISLRNSISYGRTGLTGEEVLAAVGPPLTFVVLCFLHVGLAAQSADA